MDSLNFDSLDKEALEQTLAYFKANPEPQPIDYEFTSYRAMMGDALEEKDWLEEMQVEGTADNMAYKKPQKLPCSCNAQPVVFSCTWATCDHPICGEEMTLHLTGHGQDAMERFTAPSRCIWPDCSSKATFKTLPTYKRHLNNIHVKPLLCAVPRCSYKKPFRNQNDLDRHSATIHSDVKEYECPYESCESETTSFARRDKWLKHIQETIHENDAFCPYYHCVLWEASKNTSRGFTDRNQISRHFSNEHARNGNESYKCALDSCANAVIPNHWSKNGLRSHLRQDHGLSWYPYSVAVANLSDKDRKVSAKHLPNPIPKEYHDCKLCATSDQEDTQSGTTAVPVAQYPLCPQLEGPYAASDHLMH